MAADFNESIIENTTDREAALMLDHLKEAKAAEAIRQAAAAVLKEGKMMPPDLGGKAKTVEVAKAIAEAI